MGLTLTIGLRSLYALSAESTVTLKNYNFKSTTMTNLIKGIEAYTSRQLRSLLAVKEYGERYGLHQEDIVDFGYNQNSGYIYIVFDGYLTLAVFEGRTEDKDIVISGYDFDVEEEIEFNTIEEYKIWKS